ncbi:hypothetical protein BDW02DRAFT_633954 [Decorospora gaudefroyi]|uniref:Uncharacterized protein n=1 Tax=Decorospora gaudefroyi TaxID=184978 RepID=A0A6A5K1D2_9PLEO|nr:hypothetical protein BDW02DRAFT_633954 [Decorospora gaudefroyi]
MTALDRLLPRSQPPATEKCHILAAPVEIRLLVYRQIAPAGFLPDTHYRVHFGLFLACKQLRDEMEYECLRMAPKILQKIHSKCHTPMKIRPPRPTNFASLMHVTIGIPRWAMFSPNIQNRIYHAVTPLLDLHLSSLTIGIEELESEEDLLELMSALTPRELQRYLDLTRLIPFKNEEPTANYGVLTTYTSVVGLATAINCLVAPRLCVGGHHEENFWCIRAHSLHPPPRVTCNIRKVILSLKKLHDEVRCRCGFLPHQVYLDQTLQLRWSPTDEASLLRKEGWCNVWTTEKFEKVVRRFFSDMPPPAQFIRYKLKKREGRLMKAVKGLLRCV